MGGSFGAVAKSSGLQGLKSGRAVLAGLEDLKT
jgi:hypothetical protein